MLERIIKWTSTYKDVKEENDNLIEENFTKEKKIHSLNLKNQDLKDEIVELKVKLSELEASRRAVAGRLGGVIAKRNQLEKEKDELDNLLAIEKEKNQKFNKLLEEANCKINFLKNCKRAPDLREIKNYFEGGKIVRIKNK